MISLIALNCVAKVIKIYFFVRVGYVHLGSQGRSSGTYSEDIWSTSLWSHSRDHGMYFSYHVHPLSASLSLSLSLSLLSLSFLSPPSPQKKPVSFSNVHFFVLSSPDLLATRGERHWPTSQQTDQADSSITADPRTTAGHQVRDCNMVLLYHSCRIFAWSNGCKLYYYRKN